MSLCDPSPRRGRSTSIPSSASVAAGLPRYDERSRSAKGVPDRDHDLHQRAPRTASVGERDEPDGNNRRS